MKKVGLFLLLTYVVAVLCASLVTLSSPLSVTSKVIILISCGSVYSSVVLLAILAWLDGLPTTKTQAGLNRLQTLKAKEEAIRLKVSLGMGTKNPTTKCHPDCWRSTGETCCQLKSKP